MNVLVLEDESYRQKLFRQALIGTAFVIVSTAAECIKQLTDRDWDFLFLDHDLGGEIMVSSGPGTGYEVACWLKANPDRKPGHIIVHSLNNIGGPNIERVLPGSRWLPGCWGNIEVLPNGEGLKVEGH